MDALRARQEGAISLARREAGCARLEADLRAGACLRRDRYSTSRWGARNTATGRAGRRARARGRARAGSRCVEAESQRRQHDETAAKLAHAHGALAVACGDACHAREALAAREAIVADLRAIAGADREGLVEYRSAVERLKRRIEALCLERRQDLHGSGGSSSRCGGSGSGGSGGNSRPPRRLHHRMASRTPAISVTTTTTTTMKKTTTKTRR